MCFWPGREETRLDAKVAKLSEKRLIIAVDTSGRKGSVAVGFGKKIVAKTIFSGLIRHNAELFVSIKELLNDVGKKPSQIERIYICAGPGSFAGIRIAVTMAKMISYGCGAKIVAVNTMDALISNIEDLSVEQNIRRAAVVIDAKRGQFYVGRFELLEGKWQKKTSDCLLKPEEFVAQFGWQDELIWLLGEGLVYYSDRFKAPSIRILDEKYWQVSPDGLYSAGQAMDKKGLFTEAAEIVPIYLRQPEAVENWEKRNVKIKDPHF